MRLLIAIIIVFLSNNVFSEILLSDIKLYDNINDHFSNNNIKKFSVENEPYGLKEEYSQLYFTNPSIIFDENFTLVMVIFKNKTREIEYVSGLYENLNNCIKFRDQQILLDKSIKISDGETLKQKHDGGLEQNLVQFSFKNYVIKHSCDYYSEPSQWAGTIDYRLDYHTWTYNDWITKIMGTIRIE